jgi:tRNA(Ile)-lysidine synthase
MGASPTPRTADAQAVAVAFSGGADSTALLLATVRQARPLKLPVLALHVHHGLMPEADAWVAHAEAVCAQLGVPLHVHRLQGAPEPGDSVEAWARRHRYPALAAMAQQAGATLVLLAHHAEDQAETVLLQALRGGGPAGLAAMPARWQALGVHWARPWLHQPKERLATLVGAAGLPVVRDPSNADPRFARGRLRTQVWPVLQMAFPQVATVLGEVARHAAQARTLADEVAQLDLPGCRDEAGRLVHRLWSALPPARRRNALNAWLAALLPDGVPVALTDRLLDEWTGQGGRWPAPGGWLHASRGRLAVERSPSAK